MYNKDEKISDTVFGVIRRDTMQEQINFSGNLRIRIPKSLHEKLSQDSKKEGISLNQYIVYLLTKNAEYNFFNSKDINKRLVNIKEKIGLENLEGLVEEIKNLIEKIDEIKKIVIREIRENKNLSKNIEKELIDKYPLMSGKALGEKYPLIKKPTIKVVLEDSTSNFSDIENILKDKCSSARLSEVNIDELSDTFYIDGKISSKDLNSKVIYFDEKDFKKLVSTIKDISDTFKKNGEKIKFYPSYVWEKLDI